MTVDVLYDLPVSWRDLAGCAPERLPKQVSPDDFFAHCGVGAGGVSRKVQDATRRALAVCNTCDVIDDCDIFIASQPKRDREGVWAGRLFTTKDRDIEGVD